MSKAARLGASSAFGRASTARSSRRDAIDSTINGDNASTATITDLPVTLISENPDNPRNHLRDLDETVESVREIGVILPIVVATVEAYLHNRPDRTDDLDDGTQYIVVDGHRRLEAARRVGLATIPVRVDNARVSTDEALLEAAFVANYHRDDMTELEEAHALNALVLHYGSQTKAAKRLGIRQNTISTKLSLLKLTPELQKDLVTGARKVEHVRNLGKLSAEEQIEKADARAEAARVRERPSRQPEAPPAHQRSDYHGVIITESPAEDERPSAPTASASSAPTTSSAPVPGARPPATDDGLSQQREPTTLQQSDNSQANPPWAAAVPWDRPDELGSVMIKRMELQDRREIVKTLLAAMPVEP
ncbi:ParB/RepB/Spo0J family partition protein [Streptomyces sp. NPDC095613]|uniref:ParB/RepB/Spo0J family partition protein n=1 Tax=Streptomyces sp. NPDC095613 TaxID=3155540 RepID=UPI003325667C